MDSDTTLNAGRKALEEGYPDRALPLLRLAASVGPQRAEANLLLGRLYLERGALSQAEEALRAASAADPSLTEPLLALGELFYRRRDVEGARAALESVLRLDPECARARELLELLPRPEDRAVLAGQLPDPPRLSALDPSQSSRRLLVLVVVMLGVLVGVLGLAFSQVRLITENMGRPAQSTPSAPAGQQ